MIDESYNGESSFNWEVIINAHVQLIISRHQEHQELDFLCLERAFCTSHPL